MPRTWFVSFVKFTFQNYFYRKALGLGDQNIKKYGFFLVRQPTNWLHNLRDSPHLNLNFPSQKIRTSSSGLSHEGAGAPLQGLGTARASHASTLGASDRQSSEEMFLLAFQTSGSRSYQHTCKSWAQQLHPNGERAVLATHPGGNRCPAGVPLLFADTSHYSQRLHRGTSVSLCDWTGLCGHLTGEDT